MTERAEMADLEEEVLSSVVSPRVGHAIFLERIIHKNYFFFCVLPSLTALGGASRIVAELLYCVQIAVCDRLASLHSG